MSDENLISQEKAAELLGISVASIKNWEKHGYIVRKNGNYSRKEVIELLAKIQNGEINRLNKRANKKLTKGTIGPSPEFTILCRTVSELKAETQEIMFLLSLKLFIDHDIIRNAPLAQLLQFNSKNYHNKAVLTHLKNRLKNLNTSGVPLPQNFNDAADTILKLELPRCSPAETDVAGIIYQALSSRGDRSVSGSFYTPPDLAEAMALSAMTQLSEVPEPHCIDPCCGTGQFLLSFLKAGGKPENTYGIDSDSTAALTAAANILLQCPDIEFQPRIFCTDSLMDALNPLPLPTDKHGFDLVMTNPPWGACTAGKQAGLLDRFPEIKSGESFSHFICRAFELVKDGGIISVVLPESITNVKRHNDVRRYILKNGRITRITKAGRIFKGVYSPVITLEMVKTNSSSSAGSGFVIESDFTFNININQIDAKIIDKVYSAPHNTLKGQADWALGIVTGDNDRWIKQASEYQTGMEPIIKGSDIMPGGINTPSHFIHFEPDRLQQTAPEWKYRVPEKLVYRFISKRLIFALDTKARLSLNSANILIPKTDKLSIVEIMQLLNSDLYSFIYKKRFNSVKILRSHLEELPLMQADRLSLLFTDIELLYISDALQ